MSSEEQKLNNPNQGLNKSAFTAKMKYYIRENYSLDITALYDRANSVSNSDIRLAAENAYFSKVSGLKSRVHLSGTDLGDFVRGILLRENRELSKPNGVLSLIPKNKQNMQTPLSVLTRDFIMIQIATGGPPIPLSDSKLFNDSVLELKNELMPDALPKKKALKYVKALKGNDEFKCLQYQEHYERFSVVLKTDQVIDMNTGTFDFWIQAEVELKAHFGKRRVLI